MTKNSGKKATAKKVSAKTDKNAKQQENIASSAEQSYQDLSSDENIASETYGSHQTLPPNLIDPDEFVPVNEDNMETDTKDFIVIPRPTPFACAVTINKTAKELPTNTIIKTINEKFACDDAFKGVNVRRVNLTRSAILYFDNKEAMYTAINLKFPDLGIEQFTEYAAYKENMQFQQRTLHIPDIHLNMKQDTFKSFFSKYGNIINVKMQTRVCGSMPTLHMKSHKILHCSMNNGLDICTMIVFESILQVSPLNR
jgi:hypothetical protein